VGDGDRIGSIGAAAGERQLEHAEVDLCRADQPAEAGQAGAATGGHAVVEADGEVGRRRDLVEIEVEDRDTALLELTGDASQHARLAEPAGPDQRRHTPRRDALDERVEQVVATGHLLGCERTLERERRHLHASMVSLALPHSYSNE
jgi:hypothetical protein